MGSSTALNPGRNGVPEMAAGSRFGSSVAGMGDVDGDGTLEVAVGAFGVDSFTGAVWVLSVAPDGTLTYTPADNAHGTATFDVTVHDVRGRRVAVLVHANYDAGVHDVTWRGEDENGQRVASGTYFLRLQSDVGNTVRKVVLAK